MDDRRKSKTQGVLKEADSLFVQVQRLLEQKNMASERFNEVQDLLQRSCQKYEQAVGISPIPPIEIQHLHCLFTWGTTLVDHAQELMSIAKKKIDKFSKANRTTAHKFVNEAVLKFEKALEIIEKMKDRDAEARNTTEYVMDEEEVKQINIQQYATLLAIGRAQSIQGNILIFDFSSMPFMKNSASPEIVEKSKTKLTGALFLFKQSYNHFADCAAQDPKNDTVLRLWGSTLCKEGLALRLLDQQSEGTKKLITEGGEKIISAYRLNPVATRFELASFFLERGKESFERYKDDKTKLGESDLFFQKALELSSPFPSNELLLAYATLNNQAANFIATTALNEHVKLLAEEYTGLSEWIKTKNFQNIPGLKKFNYLTKKGKVRTSWKRRFFLLTHTSLSYFAKAGGKRLGTIPFTEIISVSEDSTDRDICFAVTTANRKYIVQADDEKQLFQWLTELEMALEEKPAPLPVF